jgi:hypothetical protein
MPKICQQLHLIITFSTPECRGGIALSHCCWGLRIIHELPWYVYYSYVHNVVVIARRHLFANLFLSFGKTHNENWNNRRWRNSLGGEIYLFMRKNYFVGPRATYASIWLRGSYTFSLQANNKSHDEKKVDQICVFKKTLSWTCLQTK